MRAIEAGRATFGIWRRKNQAKRGGESHQRCGRNALATRLVGWVIPMIGRSFVPAQPSKEEEEEAITHRLKGSMGEGRGNDFGAGDEEAGRESSWTSEITGAAMIVLWPLNHTDRAVHG